MWKIYRISTGKILKAGFDTEENAKDWVERRMSLEDSDRDVDEMDEEEEEEYLENIEEHEDKVVEDSYEPDTTDEDYPSTDDGMTEVYSDSDTDYLSEIREKEDQAADDDE